MVKHVVEKHTERWTALCVMGSIMAVTNCTSAAAVWIDPSSTVQRVIFRVSRWRGDYRPIVVHYLKVFPDANLDSVALAAQTWTFQGSSAPVREIVYGANAKHSIAPQLHTGQYEVTVDLAEGPATDWFRIDPDGRVVDLKRPNGL